jgi:hypothetical protein
MIPAPVFGGGQQKMKVVVSLVSDAVRISFSPTHTRDDPFIALRIFDPVSNHVPPHTRGMTVSQEIIFTKNLSMFPVITRGITRSPPTNVLFPP